MIYAFNFFCNRDNDLKDLMIHTLAKYCEQLKSIDIHNTDDFQTHYGNGAGWGPSMMKLQALKDLITENDIKDDDFILSVDSDVVFTSPEVFKYIDPLWGIIGTRHKPEYHTHFKGWGHMSGALIFIRGDIAKKICSLTEVELTNIRFQHFKPYDITENEDVVLSYLVRYVGANYFDLGEVPGLTSGNFEGEIIDSYNWLADQSIAIRYAPTEMKSFYHLNYCPTHFLGETVTGKWDIPRILKQKGIEL